MQKPAETKPPDELVFEVGPEDKLKMRLIQSMMEALTGKKFKFYMMDKIKLGGDAVKLKSILQEGPGAPRRQGWGLEHDYREWYYEMEKLSFSAGG